MNTSTSPKLILTYDTTRTSSIYNDGLRITVTYYPAATGTNNARITHYYSSTDSLPDHNY